MTDRIMAEWTKWARALSDAQLVSEYEEVKRRNPDSLKFDALEYQMIARGLE